MKDLESKSAKYLYEDIPLFAPALFTPYIDQDNNLKLRKKVNWNQPSTLENLPGLLLPAYQDQITYFDEVLTMWQENLPPPEESLSEDETRQLTREIAFDLFPQFSSLIQVHNEKNLFDGRSFEDFVTHEAIPKAKLFNQWIIEKLPEKYQQSLELLSEVDNVDNLIDLVRLYGGQTVTAASISKEPHSTIYNRIVAKEVNILLGLVYLETVEKLARWPNEERLLKKFTDQVSSLLYNEEHYELYMLFERGSLNCVLSRLNKINNPDEITVMPNESVNNNIEINSEDSAAQDDQNNCNNGNCFEKTTNIKVRRFGPSVNQIVMVEDREKEDYSRYFKMLRNREYPLTDTIAARFVVGDLVYTDMFVKDLFNRLNENIREINQKNLKKRKGESERINLEPEWDYKFESKRTKNPQSVISATNYFAWKKDNPEIRIEIQVYGLRRSDGSSGTIIQKKYEPVSNDNAYKMRQLYKAILPVIRPYDLYGVNWQSKEVQDELDNFANAKALGLSVNEYLNYRNPPKKTAFGLLYEFVNKKKKTRG